MEIKIRPIFRVLGFFLCTLNILVFYDIFFNDYEINRDELIFFVVCSIVFFPLVFSGSILGKVPDFITKLMSEEMINEWNETEKMFTKFDARSIAFAVVFLTMVAFTIYINN